jgi:hypothetical protein
LSGIYHSWAKIPTKQSPNLVTNTDLSSRKSSQLISIIFIIFIFNLEIHSLENAIISDYYF